MSSGIAWLLDGAIVDSLVNLRSALAQAIPSSRSRVGDIEQLWGILHLTPETASQRYFVGRTDGPRAPFEQLLFAVV
jgi:hypothetical protein